MCDLTDVAGLPGQHGESFFAAVDGGLAAPISAACMGIGMFADERILAVAPLVILWHLVKKGSPADNWRREATVRAAWIGGAAAIWFIGYLAIRHASQINPAVYRKAALVSPRDNNIMIWPAWYFALRGMDSGRRAGGISF